MNPEWIDVREKLPEEGQECWTVERYDYGRPVAKYRFSCPFLGKRTYRTRGRNGKLLKSPWNVKKMEVHYWIPIPAIPEIDNPEEWDGS